MKINIDKTELCVFFYLSEVISQDFDIIMDSKKINKKSSPPTLLGFILDGKLTFQTHMDSIDRQALQAAVALHVVAKSKQVSAKNMIQLYKSLVLPHLEYASWKL